MIAINNLWGNRSISKESLANFLDSLVVLLMVMHVFFAPFPHTTTIKEICFYLSCAIALFLFLTKRKGFFFYPSFLVPFGLLLIWSLIGLLGALDVENSSHDIRAHFVKYIIFYYLLVNFFDSPKKIKVIVWSVIASATTLSIGYIVYFYFVEGYNFSIRLALISYLHYIYVFGFVLSLNNLFNEQRIKYLILNIICIISTFSAIILSQTRSAFLALIIASMIILLKWPRALLTSLLVCFFIVLSVAHFNPAFCGRFNLENILNNERIGINLTSIEIIKDYPIVGIGFGMQTYGDSSLVDLNKYNERVSKQYRQNPIVAAPHNIFFDFAVRTGLVGLGLFLYLLIVFFRVGFFLTRFGHDNFVKSWGLCSIGGLCGFLVQALFSDATFGLQAVMFYINIAMINILWKLDIDARSLISS